MHTLQTPNPIAFSAYRVPKKTTAASLYLFKITYNYWFREIMRRTIGRSYATPSPERVAKKKHCPVYENILKKYA
jgi:hypothetical protein